VFFLRRPTPNGREERCSGQENRGFGFPSASKEV
jgi:hypothetical protein